MNTNTNTWKRVRRLGQRWSIRQQAYSASTTLLFAAALMLLVQPAFAGERHEAWGRILGAVDAAIQSSQDHERHDHHYSSSTESDFQKGYKEGYGSGSVRDSLDDGGKYVYDDGKGCGAGDANNHYPSDYRRHRDRYISQYESAFRQGYDAGYSIIAGPRDHHVAMREQGHPQADVDRAHALLTGDEALTVLNISPGSEKEIDGAVNGYQADVYALAVPAGSILKVEMRGESRSAYYNVQDVSDQSGAAVHRGETQGKVAEINVRATTTYLIRPFLEKPAAQNGDLAQYKMWVVVIGN